MNDFKVLEAAELNVMASPFRQALLRSLANYIGPGYLLPDPFSSASMAAIADSPSRGGAAG